MRVFGHQPSVFSLQSSVFSLLLLSISVTACGIEGPIINRATRDRSTILPKAADNVVTGTVEGAPDGTGVDAFLSGGEALEGVSGVVGGGAFEVRFPGNTEFAGVVLQSRWKGGQALALVPFLQRQLSVLDPERVIDLGLDAPGMSPMSAGSTAFTLILWGKNLAQGKAPGALSPDAIRKSASKLAGLLATHNAAVEAFVTMVASLQAGAGKDGTFPFTGVVPAGSEVGDLVDEGFLAAHATGVDREAFASALLAAAAEVEVEVCLASNLVRVVFLCDMRPGALDGNCDEVDPFKWAIDAPGKTLFFTGGIHETTPVCTKGGEPPACLTEAVVDDANQAMGNWAPNKVEMYDDGTRGDAAKGDGIYTLALDVPFLAPDPADPAWRGVRIGYKYSWGEQGSGWTGTEEWPGNQRILEIVDTSGDGVVTRMDVFGDEATNKDKANSLTFSNGGCGVNHWEDEVKPGCAHDTRENLVDTDGDCTPDTWPQPGSASPITVDCDG